MQINVRQLLLSQLFIVLFAAIITFAPGMAFIAIIAYIALMVAIQMKMGGGGQIHEEVAKSKSIMREHGLDKLALGDDKLVEESLQVMKSTMIPTLASFPVIIALYYTIPRLLEGVMVSSLGEYLGRFVMWIAVFEVVFGASSLFRAVVVRKIGQAYPLLLAKGYELREKGLILHMGGRKVTLTLPLDETRYSINVDMRRSFVEIVDRKAKVRYRIYTRKPDQLYRTLLRLAKGR